MKSFTSMLVVVAVVLALFGLSVFTVYESDRAIIARLGELQKNSDGSSIKVLGPGIHWKVPFVDVAYIFDARLNMTEVPSERIVTKKWYFFYLRCYRIFYFCRCYV